MASRMTDRTARLGTLFDRPMVVPSWPCQLMALDLASHRTGAALLLKPDQPPAPGTCLLGVIAMETRGQPVLTRLAALGRQLGEMLQRWLPDLVIVESPDLSTQGMTTTPATLLGLYGALGVAVGTCGDHQVPLYTVDPRAVRDRLTGNATAAKSAAWTIVEQRGYTLKRSPTGAVDPDMADALALAIVAADEISALQRANALAYAPHRPRA